MPLIQTPAKMFKTFTKQEQTGEHCERSYLHLGEMLSARTLKQTKQEISRWSVQIGFEKHILPLLVIGKAKKAGCSKNVSSVCICV